MEERRGQRESQPKLTTNEKKKKTVENLILGKLIKKPVLAEVLYVLDKSARRWCSLL